MRAGKIALVLIVIWCAMNWVRAGGNATPLPATFPGLGGPGQPPLFIAAGIVMLIITACGLARLQRRPQDEEEVEEPEPVAMDEEQDDDSYDDEEQPIEERDEDPDNAA